MHSLAKSKITRYVPAVSAVFGFTPSLSMRGRGVRARAARRMDAGVAATNFETAGPARSAESGPTRPGFLCGILSCSGISREEDARCEEGD